MLWFVQSNKKTERVSSKLLSDTNTSGFCISHNKSLQEFKSSLGSVGGQKIGVPGKLATELKKKKEKHVRV